MTLGEIRTMEITTLPAERRELVGTRVSRLLRDRGMLPGIIYGHGEEPEAFAVPVQEFILSLRGGVRLLGLKLDGKESQYLIKEVQYDHLQKSPIHLDLARVDMHEKVKVAVSIELRGTPKGVADGGVVEHLMDAVEVECLASNIPAALHPSVVHLGIGDALLIKDLDLPEGVVPVADLETKIALVRVLAEQPEEEEPEEGAETDAAEPERIGRVAETPDDKDKKKDGDAKSKR